MTHLSRFVAIAFATVAVHAQNPAPAFEVVSVKSNDSASGNSSSRNLGNRYTATNVTVVQLLRNAYGIQEFQIAGGQTLLAERFTLTFHREQREASIYSLVVAKGGHKLTPGDPAKCPNPAGCGFNASPTQIVGDSVSMSQLAARLSRSIGIHVVDNTGLPGWFDLKLEWTVEDQFVGRGATASPTIFPAIQEQLGLRLESARGPVETLVIDRVERPTEN